ncbi:helix-turn-helix domain-containing protein [Natrinema zhouii]|uniref:Helix-turn-helix domain-containing protein n=2 Tax=Natrinema zhouii TaxID=1710539 RepID=A0A7D6GYE4_9EURY|nr:helix-turn-helix domain-containing protein [Natrinema zhouii]QLK27826.1 helix-turn-helix domain-containing protein [Natrinema zhouii]
MLLATLLTDYPILRETLSRAPNTKVTWEQSDLTEDGDHQMLVWVDGEVAAFDAGLEADPTVNAPLQVVEFGDRRLYQLELTDDGQQASVYPTVIEAGNVLREVTATHEGWHFRAAFPSDEAIERFHAFFVDRGLDVELRQLYDAREPTDGSRLQYGVTDRQREALVAAVDAGYLDIPRSCSLAELGERFDISSNAMSERFRRGVGTLIENTVYPDGQSP